jgi:hypothetical protein
MSRSEVEEKRLLYENVLRANGRRNGEAMLTRGEFDELLNVLEASTATAGFFQAKFGSELAGHDNPPSPGFADFRFSNSFAETDIHTRPREGMY